VVRSASLPLRLSQARKVDLRNAHFHKDACSSEAQFRDSASFDKIQFHGSGIGFVNAQFQSDPSLAGATAICSRHHKHVWLWPDPWRTELPSTEGAVDVLARAHQDAVWRLHRAGNELRSLLREYFPAFLEVFATQEGGVTCREARAILAVAPTPASGAALTRPRIRAALRRCGRIYHIEAWT
jgi:hypothetical protein